MTKLTQDTRNYLAQQTDITSLLGSDDLWDTWIFMDTPEVNVETTGKAMIVVSVNGSWAGSNPHNTMRFPQLIVDIWVDPTRNPDGYVKQKDASNRAEAIYKAVDKHLHKVDLADSKGLPIIWGNASQVEDRTGTRILGSSRTGEPEYRPAFDDQGAVIATVRYNVVTD